MYKGENEIVISLRKGRKTVEELSAETGLNIDTIRRAVESLKEQKVVNTNFEEESEFLPTKEFLQYYEIHEMPEYSVFKKALNGVQIIELNEQEKSIGLRWAKIKGFVDIVNGKLVAKIQATHANLENSRLISACKNPKQVDEKISAELLKRNLLQRQVKKTTYVSLTGKEFVVSEEKTFDISIPSKNAPIGKTHPLSKMKNRIKQIFIELGFEEMEGSIVETSFWNFDALFQPQDHPARELADTFYLKGKGELPEDKKIVERVKKSHEQGWKCKWNEEEAKKLVLRTHTTALSARYLAEVKDKKPRKYFAVGRVFRNEATDFKHLAEFHQVEGIIVWENATFKDLLGILKEFYRKLGFEKIRFRPSYFPYTEPSLEIEVYFEPKKQWMELGGAGIFRPEVSKPICGVYPVLAWGLSLERPLMMLMELNDIRMFYKNDLDWLKEARL